jgi:electron transport complex protein RnfC
MFPFSSTRKMIGGLVFGQPAWMPERIEETFESSGAAAGDGGGEAGSAKPTDPPKSRAALLALLEKIHLDRTSAIIPGLAEQLRHAADRPIRAVVLNGLPTQPEFALPAALTRLALEELFAGLEALQIALDPKRTLVVVDRHDFRSRRLWKRFLRRRPFTSRPIAVKSLLNRYPQAHPTILTRTLFGKRLPVGSLPVRQSLIIVDPVTVWALGRFLRGGQVFSNRPVQVFVQGEVTPRVLMGRLGQAAAQPAVPENQTIPGETPVVRPPTPDAALGETIAQFCKRHKIDIEGMQVIRNGMMAGEAVDPHATCISAATESITLRQPVEIENPSACLACGWCVDVCPTSLIPVRLMVLSEKIPTGVEIAHGQLPAAAPRTNAGPNAVASLLTSREARESLHCIACGLCSYVCPTRLPLMSETLRLRERVVAARPHHPEASA